MEKFQQILLSWQNEGVLGKVPQPQEGSLGLIVGCADPRYDESLGTFFRRIYGRGKVIFLSELGGAVRFGCGNTGENTRMIRNISDIQRIFRKIPKVWLLAHPDCKWCETHRLDLAGELRALRRAKSVLTGKVVTVHTGLFFKDPQSGLFQVFRVNVIRALRVLEGMKAGSEAVEKPVVSAGSGMWLSPTGA